MAPHSSTPAWKIPCKEELGGLESMGSLRVGHNWATSLSLFTFLHWRRKWQSTPVFLPGEPQGRGSLVGCRLWGCTCKELNTTELLNWIEQQNVARSAVSCLCRTSMLHLALPVPLTDFGIFLPLLTLETGSSSFCYWFCCRYYSLLPILRLNLVCTWLLQDDPFPSAEKPGTVTIFAFCSERWALPQKMENSKITGKCFICWC